MQQTTLKNCETFW